ncbi:hypothetical protein OF829_13250 [Sphingomonas sp. LB-2]|uniref:hypothetical protein n=1 Tax=Sphingomonas caeni TaxID=2984949 RepID=UPI00222ED93B|nr:hypothetical protein [Sphingomonas caeni]MCW3848206.1 hypothetical protein [Sphingomonas caeni]
MAEAHAALRARDDIQFELPHTPPPQRTEPMPMPALGALFWLLVVLGVAMLLYLIVKSIVEREPRGQRVSSEHEIAQWRPEEKVARALLAEADAMAAAGRYEEAARLLLHRSLEDIASRKPKLLRPALTSREIARAPMLPDAVRAAFQAMAAPVERSLFGGRSLDRAAWEDARAAYGDFALPKAWA